MGELRLELKTQAGPPRWLLGAGGAKNFQPTTMLSSSAPFLPAALAADTLESLPAMHGPQRPWIYWLSLVGVGAALGALPLVPVDITVRASGMVRPAIERIELKAAIGGRIARVQARDNDRVTANQPLVELAAADTEERLARNRSLQRDKNALVADLRQLAVTRVPMTKVAEDTAEFPVLATLLQSSMLVRDYARFLAQHAITRMVAVKARQIQERTLVLAGKGIATDVERDDARYAAARASADLQLLVQQTLAGWQTQLHEEETGLGQLISEEKRLQEELALAVIRSPVAGTLQGLVGLSAGALVSAGQSLGQVSPDAPLLVETYVSPRDIGGLRLGQDVRLQVDAYPYTQWGLLEGRIAALAADATASSQPAVFKVVVQPVTLNLHLRNGVTGAVRKGMTLTARFVVGRRSLLQVLYEDASHWLGPQERPSSQN